jgi:hypothetical protein
LLALYFVLLHFFKRGKREDEKEREFQREMMRKIDTVLFPTIEQLVAQGMEVPLVVAKNQREEESITRVQVDEDVQLQARMSAPIGNGGFLD